MFPKAFFLLGRVFFVLVAGWPENWMTSSMGCLSGLAVTTKIMS